MESKKLPEKIYKYTKVDQNFYDLLINAKLWFSNPKDFNDPFDNNISIKEELDEHELSYLLEDERFKGKIEHKKDTIISHFKQNPEKLNNLYESLKQLTVKSGICCFSENYDNLLMWAHYSNCHKGVCVEFDTSCLQEWYTEIAKVNYQVVMPNINFLELCKEDVLSSLPFCKSIHWQYEQEIRIWGKSSGLHSFPMKAITGIFFGLKMTNEQITAICRLMVRLRYEKVEYLKAELHKTEFKLDFNEINVIDEE